MEFDNGNESPVKRKCPRYRERKSLKILYAIFQSKTEKNPQNLSGEYVIRNRKRIELLYKEVIDLFESRRIYRDKELSIDSLAIMLNTNNTYISNAINRVGNTSFPKLINDYRIAEVKQLIEDCGRSLTGKDLAEKVGYRDKTTFYKHFKERMGSTPKEYINSTS